MADNVRHVVDTLRLLNRRYEDTAAEMNEFMRAQADGEKPDVKRFEDLLAKQSTNRQIMHAQFRLYEKPLKTVLNETK
jgi:hypothetical protein